MGARRSHHAPIALTILGRGLSRATNVQPFSQHSLLLKKCTPTVAKEFQIGLYGRSRFGTLLRQLERGTFERTAVSFLINFRERIPCKNTVDIVPSLGRCSTFLHRGRLRQTFHSGNQQGPERNKFSRRTNVAVEEEKCVCLDSTT